MSEDQKFLELLKELGKIIKEKNDELIICKFQLSDIRKKISEYEQKSIAETERKENYE